LVVMDFHTLPLQIYQELMLVEFAKETDLLAWDAMDLPLERNTITVEFVVEKVTLASIVLPPTARTVWQRTRIANGVQRIRSAKIISTTTSAQIHSFLEIQINATKFLES